MSFAVATFNLPNYSQLAEITDQSKLEYCNKHGYKFFALREAYYTPNLGFNKIHYTLELFENYPDIEWLLFSECDAMVTNYNIKIGDCINDQHHFIVSVDRLTVNSGNFLARNSPEGRDFLNMVLAEPELYDPAAYNEQNVICDNTPEYAKKGILQVMPQKFMNSYECFLYGEVWPPIDKDVGGNPANWEPGDWIIHWPGMSLETRLHRAATMYHKIIR